MRIVAGRQIHELQDTVQIDPERRARAAQTVGPGDLAENRLERNDLRIGPRDVDDQAPAGVLNHRLSRETELHGEILGPVFHLFNLCLAARDQKVAEEGGAGGDFAFPVDRDAISLQHAHQFLAEVLVRLGGWGVSGQRRGRRRRARQDVRQAADERAERRLRRHEFGALVEPLFGFRAEGDYGQSAVSL